MAGGIATSEYSRRRARVLRELGEAAGVVFAGDGGAALNGRWQPDWNFYYLTGIRDEAGAVLLLDPKAEDPRRRCILFLRPLNPEAEQWDGLRDRIGQDLRKRWWFETVMRTTALPRVLTDVARRRKRLACLHPFAIYPAEVSPDLSVFRRVSERIPGVSIDDRTTFIPAMRSIKSVGELKLLKSAVNATARGFEAALRAIRPGVGERDVQRAVEDGFLQGGADGVGYNSIVGSGVNGTVLHYMANDGEVREGDLVVIDAGARVGGYTADVTRTFPASGRFTREQREIYGVVLKALDAGTRAVRPGVRMHHVDAAARAVIDKAGYGDAFPHGIGHQLGIEVHDATPDGPLKAGMVVTVEPGIYLPDRGLGVRIEDDVLVTPRGPKVLTESIPRTVDAIEAAMGRRKGR